MATEAQWVRREFRQPRRLAKAHRRAHRAERRQIRAQLRAGGTDPTFEGPRSLFLWHIGS